MSEVTFQLNRPWVLRTPHVYRYLDRKWVDEFFESGVLQLSSFAKFRQNPHEHTGDANEGDGILVGTSEKQTVYAVLNDSPFAYIMSTSLTLSRKIADNFGYDACFRIKDTVAFGATVANYLPGCKGGAEGPCNYSPHRSIHANMPEIPVTAGQPPSINEALGALQAAAGLSLMFTKGMRHVEQMEYRFTWGVPAPIQNTIKITCPEARQYCEKVDIPA